MFAAGAIMVMLANTMMPEAYIPWRKTGGFVHGVRLPGVVASSCSSTQ
jgi:hypothetical protein